MDMRRHRTTTWAAVVATGLFAALTMTALPSYAEEASPSPDTSPSPESPGTGPSAPEPSGSSESAADPSSAPPAAVPALPSADLGVVLASSVVPAGSGIKVFRVDLRNSGPSTAEDVALDIDATELRDDIAIDFADDCAVDGRTASCPVASPMPMGWTHVVTFGLTAPKDAPLGDAGALTVTVRASTHEPSPYDNTQSRNIVVVEKDADLVAFGEDLRGVAPGSVHNLDFSVLNSSTLTAKNLVVNIQLPAYVTFHDRYDNCEYHADGRFATCGFDGELPPYQYWTVSEQTPISVAVSKRAPGPQELGMIWVDVYGEADVQAASGHVAKGELGKAAAGALGDPDRGDSAVGLLVTTTRGPVDLAAVGATVTGKVGDVRTIKIGAKNHGPSDYFPVLDKVHSTIVVEVPQGTEVIAAPDECLGYFEDGWDWVFPGRPGARAYRCDFQVRAGETGLREFRLKLVGADVENGQVSASARDLDDNPANETAPIVVKLSAGTVPSAAPGPGGGGGGLPVTGTPLAGLVGGGAAAVLLGIVLFLVGRWRRIPATV
ncbi:MAG: hypothetical protein ACRDT6_19510 [Micromonosporaceae bacterium]